MALRTPSGARQKRRRRRRRCYSNLERNSFINYCSLKFSITLVLLIRCSMHFWYLLFMAALCNRADHYIFALWFLLSSVFFISSPNLSRRRLDVYHRPTSTHGVALVRILDAGLKRAARGSLKVQDAKKIAKNSPSGHRRTTLSSYIFASEAHIDNRKKTC